MTVSKLQLPAKENAVQLKINEIIDNLGGGGANTDLSNLTATGEAHFQEPLVSGTNIKTINSVSLLGSGNISLQPTLVSGTNIKTINSTSLLGSGNISVQETLESGTNIKTINSTSLLGSGNISVLTSSSTQVASSRFDSAVVYKYSKHDMTTTTGTKTISLSSYLPSGTSSYLVLMTAYANTNNSTPSVVDVSGNSSMTALTLLRAGANGRYQQNSVWLPVNSSKTITVTVSNSAISNTLLIELYAYRRIGTNS